MWEIAINGSVLPGGRVSIRSSSEKKEMRTYLCASLSCLSSLSQLLRLFLFDADLLGKSSFAERNRDLQHAVLVAGVNLAGIDWSGKGDTASKGARTGLLDQPVAFLVLFGRRTILPLERQGILAHGQLDILGFDPRQFGFHLFLKVLS